MRRRRGGEGVGFGELDDQIGMDSNPERIADLAMRDSTLHGWLQGPSCIDPSIYRIDLSIIDLQLDGHSAH